MFNPDFNNCGCYPKPTPEPEDIRDTVCDIESICCEGFVKEKFTITAVVTDGGETVYLAPNGAVARGIVKIKNLSLNNITVVTNGFSELLAPNAEMVLVIDNLLFIDIFGPSGSRALLCFDLQITNIVPPVTTTNGE